MSAQLRDSLEYISPIAWDELPGDDELPEFLRNVFRNAEQIVNSLPAPCADPGTPFDPAPANSAQTALETLCEPADVPMPVYERNEAAMKDWGKPYKMSNKDNPLHVQCFKMAASDRHGAYFGRRSVHQGIGFDRWRRCAEREFLESVQYQDAPGAGAVRGISADRRIEKKEIKGVGQVEVWQTSSAFPGPVTPRGSLVLVISATDMLSKMPDGKPPPRHFAVISRPTVHADAPDRSNLVKMSYESAEVIREIPIEGNSDPESNPLEWLMVTRSDPGGGIPKFMVERGTPSSIVGDVSKFINWATKKPWDELQDDADADEHIERANTAADEREGKPADAPSDAKDTPGDEQQSKPASHDGLVSSAVGAVQSVAAGYIPYLSQPPRTRDKPDSDKSSTLSSSSSGTFASAIDDAESPTHAQHLHPHARHQHFPSTSTEGQETPTQPLFSPSASSLAGRSSGDSMSSSSRAAAAKGTDRARSKELQRLMQKRMSIDARASKDRDAAEKKLAAASEKEARERERLLERHERERRKQEERYQHELAKLDERRIKEERKDAQRRRKQEDKDELARVKRERDEWKDRCAVAEREAELLRAELDELAGKAAREHDQQQQPARDGSPKAAS